MLSSDQQRKSKLGVTWRRIENITRLLHKCMVDLPAEYGV